MNLVLAGISTAQTNLVVNGSFEDTVSCGTPTQCALLKARHWYNPTLSSPDLFDCDLDRQCGYAMNYPYWNGYMYSQDGDRHAGEYLWDGPNPNSYVREFMMTELSEPLVSGHSYGVSLWYASRRPHEYGVDHIGVWFGPFAQQEDTAGPMSLVPQVRLMDPDHPYLGESEVWTQLVDTLVAAGSERWMVIGNFDPVGQVNGSHVNPDGLYETCYYYIDNVVVRPLEATGVAERIDPKVWWNGQTWQVTGSTCSTSLVLEVFNALGAMVHQERISATGTAIALDFDPPVKGLYVLRLTCGNRRSMVRFIK